MQGQEGFSLIEALVAMVILTFVALTMAQMIGMGMLADANSADLTSATALSANKIEELRNSDYDALVAGGNLAANDEGYFDLPDTDGDGSPDYTRRWSVGDLTGGKSIQVRVMSNADTLGAQRDATMATVVADR